MEKQKRKGFLGVILNFILKALIAKIMGISPVEAAAFLESEVHHVR